MQTKTYQVHRTMQGGAHEYQPGDTRELTEADAAELVALGALSLKGHDPVEREPAVRHTFGSEPSAITGYTVVEGQPAVAQSVTVERKAAAKVVGKA